MPENRDALIALASTLNDARWTANSIDCVAPTMDAYGSITEALRKVIGHIVKHPSYVDDVEQSLLDGCSVARAIQLADQEWDALPAVVYVFDHETYADTEYARQALLEAINEAITTEAYSDADLESEEDREGAISMSFDGTDVIHQSFWDNIIAIMQHSPYMLDVKRIERESVQGEEIRDFQWALV